MNESNFENLIKAYKKVHMTAEEKREVFKQSMLVIEKIEAVSLAHAGLDSQAKKGGVSGHGHSLAPSSWMSYFRKRQFIPALLATFLLLFTGGASLLADEALPGDSLYSFKLKINEPIRELTAVTDEAKAKLAVEVTERRLQEAAMLSAQGKLDEHTKQILQDEFVKKASQIRNRVASLVSNNNLNAAQEVVVDFESALKTHETILTRLAINSGGDFNTQTAGADAGTATMMAANATGTDAGVATLAISATGDTTNTAGGAEGAASMRVAMAPTPAVPLSGAASFLKIIKSELDSTVSSRINIEEQVTAGLALAASGTTSQALIESNLKELKFTISDIEFEMSQYAYATSTVVLAQKRIALASSSIKTVTALLKENKIIEAASSSRVVLQSLAELQTVLKLEKGSKSSLEGRLDIATLIDPLNSTTTVTVNGTSSTAISTSTKSSQSSGSATTSQAIN